MSIRTKILLVFVSLIFAVVIGFIYFIIEEIWPRYVQAQEEIVLEMSETLATVLSENAVSEDIDGNAVIDTELLHRTFSALPNRELNAKIYDLQKSTVDLRVYLTDKRGVIIFDSDNGRDEGRQYTNWRDVSRTFRGRYGARGTMGDPIYPEGHTMYVARPVLWKGDVVGVLSIGKPMRNTDRIILNLNDRLWLSGILLAALGALIGFLLNYWITQPLKALREYALKTSQGQKLALPKFGKNEIGDAAGAIEVMQRSIDGRKDVEDYVQTLTHELKAPIAGIRGAAELLQEPMASEKRDKFLSNILTQTNRMQDMINRLLKLAELENTRQLSHIEVIDLESLITSVCNSQMDFAETNNKKIIIRLNPISVMGDRFMLEIAVTNLVKNAIEHSYADTEIFIELSADSRSAEIAVRNKGKSIPDYAVNRIFDRFYGIGDVHHAKGSGIGLSFVRKIAELHQGEVLLKQNSDDLICFALRLTL